MSEKKVILISIDGMRPDGFLSCGNPYADELMKISYHSLSVKTVFPSVTLPCHMSLFHSVPPERHGITTNLYMPMVRPIRGLFEKIAEAEKVCAFYYGWEPLRDVALPDSLVYSEYIMSSAEEYTDGYLTDSAISRIEKSKPDFVFLYMVQTDKAGHSHGFMSDEYLRRINLALDNVKRVVEKFSDEYTIIVTADHGGHARVHGTDMDEDMTIPNFFIGEGFEPGKKFTDGSILNIAPTIAKIMGVKCDPEWEGTSII